jgi:hypothetical protein
MKKYFQLSVSFIFVLLITSRCASDSSVAPGGAGAGGSMARFAISGDNLYTVSSSSLKVFDISQADNPQQGSETKLGFGIETIFPYGQHLFIGSQTGMHIYTIENPQKPEQVSVYQHILSCDPVVVQGNYAYVTLRSGSECRNGRNVLDVLDISDLKSPQRVRSYNMQNPHGLGIDGNTLFVCEGDYGLKIFDASQPDNPKQINSIDDIRTYDVIPQNQLLMVVGKDGLYQYDYSNLQQLKLLSKLTIYQ